MNELQSAVLEIDRGLSLEISATGSWLIRSNDQEFCLQDTSDFYRAWLLLERPYQEVATALDEVARQGNALIPFPFAMLIGSTLKASSAQWTDRAIAWVPFLSADERASLRELFVETMGSKWASQKGKQLAQKYVRQIDQNS